MTDNKKKVLALIEALTTGTLLSQFRDFYADDVVMSENGEDDPKRHGIEGNLAYETFFIQNAEWHGAKVEAILGDGEFTAYEMWMDFTFLGQRVTRTQVALQEWRNGKIVRETFYYKA